MDINKIKSIKLGISLLIVASIIFLSCRKELKKKETIIQEQQKRIEKVNTNTVDLLVNEKEVKDSSKIIPNRFFTSALRENQRIEHNRPYTDTVKYISKNDDYDSWYLYVTKNKEKIGLIYNSHEALIAKLNVGDSLLITWEKRKLIHAGDTEIVDFKEFLTDVKRLTETIETNNIEESKKSFTISCGSGCAMIYEEENVNIDLKEVKFKVGIYINEVIDDEYYKTYTFNCSDTGALEKISLKGDPSFNLNDLTPGLREQLIKYSKETFCVKKR